MLESIIGRTVEQSMTEVQHEEELLRARSVTLLTLILMIPSVIIEVLRLE